MAELKKSKGVLTSNGVNSGVTNHADGSITITSTDGTSNTIDAATCAAFSSGGLLTLEPLTAEESKRLEDLNTEKKKWVKSEKLKNFQDLPAHLRQEIVDEACILEHMRNVDSIDTSKFESQDEIDKLEAKNSRANMSPYFGGLNMSQPTMYDHGSPYAPDSNLFKYGRIINEHTKEELIEAHAAATLEESLND